MYNSEVLGSEPLLQPTHHLTNEEYHAHPAISRSALNAIAQSPMHYWHRYLNPEARKPEPTPAMKFGTAVHMAVLEPELFLETYAEAPSLPRTTKVGKEAWAAAEADGKQLLTTAELSTIEEMHTRLWEHPAAAKALRAPGINEGSYITTCTDTGLEIKCRPDRLLESGWVVDLKTTQDASAKAFAKSTANFGYHVQAAFYMHTLRSLGANPKGFIIVAIEKSAPYAVQAFRLSEETIDYGHSEMTTQLRTLSRCKDLYSVLDAPWPAYPETVTELDLPTWATRI